MRTQYTIMMIIMMCLLLPRVPSESFTFRSIKCCNNVCKLLSQRICHRLVGDWDVVRTLNSPFNLLSSFIAFVPYFGLAEMGMAQ